MIEGTVAELESLYQQRSDNGCSHDHFEAEEDRLLAELEGLYRQRRLALVEKERRQALRAAHQNTEPGCPYPTLTAAYRDGWEEQKPRHYGGETMLLKGHLLVRNAKEALSWYGWHERGKRIKQSEIVHPHVWIGRADFGYQMMIGTFSNGTGAFVYGGCGLYRDDQVEDQP